MKPDLAKISQQFNPKYIKNYDNFDANKDTVLYSGPYWNNLEIEAMLDSMRHSPHPSWWAPFVLTGVL